MTPTEHDKKLEVALMELFCRSEEFGRTFLTCASKEEFAEAVNGGALDHQQAAHEAMQLITADRKRVALEARIDELEKTQRDFVHDESSEAFDEGRLYEQFLNGQLLAELTKDVTNPPK